MRRSLLISAVLVSTVVLGASQALAFQCPKLVKQIEDEAGNRFDDAGNGARAKAEEATKLHKEGKHAEAEKAAKDGLALLGSK
jgi:hypothetical protein